MIWNPDILVGGASVLASGTLVANGDDVVEITPVPSPSGESTYRVRLKFPVNSDQDSRLSVDYSEPNVVSVTLTNLGLVGLGGTQSPIYIGNYDQKGLYISVAAQVVGEGATATRVVYYTFGSKGAASA